MYKNIRKTKRGLWLHRKMKKSERGGGGGEIINMSDFYSQMLVSLIGREGSEGVLMPHPVA